MFLLFLLFISSIATHPTRDYCRTGHDPHHSIRKCCLQYTSCPLHIESGVAKYGLVNTFDYPLYYCKCEISFYKCLGRVNTGRSISTRKSHFLETKEGSSSLRKCLVIEEKDVCLRRLMGICLRQEKVLIGDFRNISDFL